MVRVRAVRWTSLVMSTEARSETVPKVSWWSVTSQRPDGAIVIVIPFIRWSIFGLAALTAFLIVQWSPAAFGVGTMLILYGWTFGRVRVVVASDSVVVKSSFTTRRIERQHIAGFEPVYLGILHGEKKQLGVSLRLKNGSLVRCFALGYIGPASVELSRVANEALSTTAD